MRPRSLDEFLKRANVPFTAFRHAAAFSAQHQAALSHVPGRSWAKTVICFAGDEPIAAVVPAHLKVDLNVLRGIANTTELRLATEQELFALCPDCEIGAVSPFVLRTTVRVFVDRSFAGEPEMVFSAGTHTDAIRIHFGDFVHLTKPIIGTIGMQQAAAGANADAAAAQAAQPRPRRIRPTTPGYQAGRTASPSA